MSLKESRHDRMAASVNDREQEERRQEKMSSVFLDRQQGERMLENTVSHVDRDPDQRRAFLSRYFSIEH